MAVIINELEVVVENQQGDSVPRQDREAPAPPPAELDDVDDRRVFYAARVAAH